MLFGPNAYFFRGGLVGRRGNSRVSGTSCYVLLYPLDLAQNLRVSMMIVRAHASAGKKLMMCVLYFTAD